MNFLLDLFEYDTAEWTLWRDAYKGGRHFVNRYLEKISTGESTASHDRRKQLAYSPSTGREAIDEVRNSIYKQMGQVQRTNGSHLYRQTVTGELGGVDYAGRSMNSFVGDLLLPELLVMGKVGVFVDNFTAQDLGSTQLDVGDKHPFFKIVPRLAIRDIRYDRFNRMEYVEFYNTKLELEGERVKYTVTDAEGTETSAFLEIDVIPFTMFEINHSLMRDVADIQVTLLNLHANDIIFMNNNFPIYYEYGQARGGNLDHKKGENEVIIGTTRGRRVPIGGGAPGWTSPDPETLRVSMEKAEQLDQLMRRLVTLNVANQAQDSDVFDAGLSAIGKALERGENRIAELFSKYDSSKSAKILYPETFQAKTDEEIRTEVQELDKVRAVVQSDTFRRELSKKMASTMLEHLVTAEKLKTIHTEIDNALTSVCSPDVIFKAAELSLTDGKTAAEALGLPPEKVALAIKETAAKVAATISAQQKASETGMSKDRGVAGAVEMDEEQRGEEK